MAVVLWAGLRQLESLRTAMRSNVASGRYSMQFSGTSFSDLEKWIIEEELHLECFLNGQSLEDARTSKIPINSRVSIGLINTTSFLLGNNDGIVLAEGNRTTSAIAPETDHGAERSSAYWDRTANLLTTSIFVRLLATLEQFETDVLKALLFYRPAGSGTPAVELEEEEVAEDIVYETPKRTEQVDHYNFPPLWTWIKRQAEDNTQRRMIFSRAYDITFSQPSFAKLSELYEMRNAIAHGRKRVDVSIGLIFKVDAFVANTMIELRNKIYENYRLII